MKNYEINRYHMFINIRQFLTVNAADFPAASVGAAQLAEIAAVIIRLEDLGARQTSGMTAAGLGYLGKDTAREALRDALMDIARTARSMEFEFPGIAKQFRMPQSATDQRLVATAKVFIESIDRYYSEFVRYGLDEDFAVDLARAIDAFEASRTAPSVARDTHVAATAEISAAVRRGMTAFKILDGVVKNTYRHNVGQLAAWTAASHIERVGKRAKPGEPKQ